MTEKDRVQEVNDQAIEHNLIDGDMSKANIKVYEALKAITDKPIDTGSGQGCCDYWVTIDDYEYFITMTYSKSQVRNNLT